MKSKLPPKRRRMYAAVKRKRRLEDVPNPDGELSRSSIASAPEPFLSRVAPHLSNDLRAVSPSCSGKFPICVSPVIRKSGHGTPHKADADKKKMLELFSIDALSLQKLVLLMKRDLCMNGSSTINVQSEVQTLLASILISVNNHQIVEITAISNNYIGTFFWGTYRDSDGRCYSDSLADVPAMLRRKGIDPKNIPFSMDEMRRNIEKGRYRRLDKFQDDLFFLFDMALEHTHSDSQMFEDTVELWMFFLKTRDDLTRTTLLSPARWYSEQMLLEHVNEIRKRKLVDEAKDVEEDRKCETLGPKADGDVDLATAGQGGVVYRVNDYAYVAPASEDTVVQRHIMRIERLYRDSDGQTFARGEVFLTSYYDTVTVDRLIGKCHVMPVRRFMRQKPKGFDDDDVYVCECRYMGRQLHFKKLKVSEDLITDNVILFI
ncbi:unnamed protein product [Gongylonema pulchrum]|uniref:BAH domain-containing protein n=1 Tax=Gongylonema pulchrum TaxID=637853 RepID=A0A183E6N7_9BILA|nr:unnamed protein product [Gongylonema pulchrum]